MMGEPRNSQKLHVLHQCLSDLRLKLTNTQYMEYLPDWKKSDDHRFYYICSGSGLANIGNDHHRLHPGQLLFVPPHVRLSNAFKELEGNPLRIYGCHFKANVGLESLFRSYGLPNLVNVQEDRHLLVSQFQLLGTTRNDLWPTAGLKIQSALLEILAVYIDSALSCPIDSSTYIPDSKLIDTIEYIDSNLSKEITIDELSDIMHLHPNYFIRYFKAHLGLPPKRYIYERRLERAKGLLRGTDLNIGEIAIETGFYDAPHFSSSFKKFVGISPSAYRSRIISAGIGDG